MTLSQETELEIRERLVRLESGHAEIIRKLDEQNESAASFRREITEAMIGNGRPGLVTRIDRIEQREAGRAKHYWIIVTLVMTVAIEGLWRWIKGIK